MSRFITSRDLCVRFDWSLLAVLALNDASTATATEARTKAEIDTAINNVASFRATPSFWRISCTVAPNSAVITFRRRGQNTDVSIL